MTKVITCLAAAMLAWPAQAGDVCKNIVLCPVYVQGSGLPKPAQDDEMGPRVAWALGQFHQYINPQLPSVDAPESCLTNDGLAELAKQAKEGGCALSLTVIPNANSPTAEVVARLVAAPSSVATSAENPGADPPLLLRRVRVSTTGRELKERERSAIIEAIRIIPIPRKVDVTPPNDAPHNPDRGLVAPLPPVRDLRLHQGIGLAAVAGGLGAAIVGTIVSYSANSTWVSTTQPGQPYDPLQKDSLREKREAAKGQMIAGNVITGIGGAAILFGTLSAEAWCEAPDTSREITAKPRDMGAVMRWLPPQDTGSRDKIAMYQPTVLEVAKDKSEIDVTKAKGVTIDTVGSEARVRGLTNGQEYRFQVTASNGCATSHPSNKTAPVVPEPLDPPENVEADPGDQRARVRWTPPRRTGGLPIGGFLISTVPKTKFFCPPKGATSFIVPGLRNGTSWAFRVTVWNDDSKKSHDLCNEPDSGYDNWDRSLRERSTLSTHEVTLISRPQAPTRLVVDRTSDGTTVSWGPPENDGGAPVLFYLVTTNPPSDKAVTSAAMKGGLSTRLSGLKDEQPYEIQVRAVNEQGKGPSAVYKSPALPKVPVTTTPEGSGTTTPGGSGTTRPKGSRTTTPKP